MLGTVARWGHFAKHENRRNTKTEMWKSASLAVLHLECNVLVSTTSSQGPSTLYIRGRRMFQPWSPSLESGLRDDLLLHYFGGGHKYRIILRFLRNVHNIRLSMRQLKRLLRRLGLRRRRPRTAENLRLVCRLIRVSLV